MTMMDAEIFATRVGRELGPAYLRADYADFFRMRVLAQLAFNGFGPRRALALVTRP